MFHGFVWFSELGKAIREDIFLRPTSGQINSIAGSLLSGLPVRSANLTIDPQPGANKKTGGPGEPPVVEFNFG